jgi:hypothetical protein
MYSTKCLEELNRKRQILIQQIVKENNLIKLKSPYFGMDSYYLDSSKKTIYRVSNVCNFMGNVHPKLTMTKKLSN